MALTKKTFVDNQTVIAASDLNSIQDEIIANRGYIDGESHKESGSIRVTKNCRTVGINVTAREVSLTVGWNTLGTIDASYKPYYTTYVMAMNYDATNASSLPMIMRIALDGKVEVYAYTAGTYSPYASGCYLSAN